MAIKHFVYVAAACLMIGLLVFAGNVLGRAADHSTPPAAPARPTATSSPTRPPAVAHRPPVVSPRRTSPPPTLSPLPAPPAPTAGEPIQAVGIQPPRITGGEGPFGSVTGTGSNTVALTFDDGPSPEWTPRILGVLREYDIKATFCLIGENVEASPDLVRAIVADGHTLCNHSWDHNLELGQLGAAEIEADMRRTSAAIEAAAPGAPISYFRAPGGNWTESVVKAAGGLGMTPLDWTVDPRDWTMPPVASIVSTVTASCVPGAIFLLHDGGGNRANTLDAVRQFLPALSVDNAFIALPTGEV